MSEDQSLVTAPQTPQEELYPDPVFKEMVEAGLFYGRKRSRTNPRMKPFILTNRNEIEIVNLVKTREMMDAALAFLAEKVRAGANVLFVATQPPAAAVIAIANEFGYPAVATRWLGGTLTNFKIISTRIEYYKKLKSDFAKNAFEKHTKKERLEIEREIARLTETLGGLESMAKLPDVMVVVDANVHATAVREARRVRIPIVAFVNTDCDPESVEYPVVGNTKARASINWFLAGIREAILKNRVAAPAAAGAAGVALAPAAAPASASAAEGALVSAEAKKE